MARTLSMSENGRLTVPAEVRRALGIAGETEFEYEVDPGSDAIILRPAVVLRREDAWAYTPEHRAQLEGAHADVAAGRMRRLSEDELAALGD
jgi:AbrB family looped-hinge helix DNA binding protein